LMGAAAFITHQHRDRIPTLLRPSFGTWMMVGVFTLPVSLIPQVDFSANIGGLLGGLIAGALIAGDRALPIRGSSETRSARIGSLVLGAVYAAGIAGAAYAFTQHQRATDVRVLEKHVKLDRDSFVGFNKLAWGIAGDPDATPLELELAEIAAKRAVERTPSEIDSTMIEDTLATVLHRRGDHRRAAELEKRVLEAHPKPFIASQLARFLVAGTSTHAVTGQIANGLLEIRSEEPVKQETAIYAVARDGERILGLMVVNLEAGDAVRRFALDELKATWARGEVVVGMVEPGKRRTAAAWAMDPEAEKLP
jgi:hypothetical protein